MVYNKTKAGLEKGATILGIVISSITLVHSFVYFLLSCISIVGMVFNFIFIPMWLVSFAFSITTLVLNCTLVKSPVLPDGTVIQRNGTRIALIIFSFLTGQLITMGLEIAVLCLKDFHDVTPVEQTQPSVVAQSQTVQSNVNVAAPVAQSAVAPVQNTPASNQSVEGKIAELKHLKELGILDDASYNNAIKRIIESLK